MNLSSALGCDEVIFICADVHAFEASTLYMKLILEPTSYHLGMPSLSIPVPLFDKVVWGVNVNMRALSALVYPRTLDVEATEQFSASIVPGRMVRALTW